MKKVYKALRLLFGAVFQSYTFCRYSLLRYKPFLLSFLVSCMGYPTCRCVAFLPKVVLDVSVDESICPNCGPQPVHRYLQLRFLFVCLLSIRN